MQRQGDQTHLTATEARAGSTRGGVRYVLLISTLLAVLALSAIWMGGAFSARDAAPPHVEASPAPAGTTAR